jgi:hypothetical protein
MAGSLLIFLLLAGETAVAFARRQWRRGLGGLLVIVLILRVVYYLLSWNAVMLKVQRNATTPATQSIEPSEEPGP